MVVVELLLLGLVGFSVVVALITHWLEGIHEDVKKLGDEQKRTEEAKIYYCESNTVDASVATESPRFDDEPEQSTSVGGGCCGGGGADIVVENSRAEKSQQIEEPVGGDSNRNNNGDNCEEEYGFIDDWEEVDRTGLEKEFGDAVVYVDSKKNEGRIDNELKLKLYGLHKLALQGPCSVPQPMSLKVCARAKWNAWQSLGNMNRISAMEQYVMLLSRAIPHWKSERSVASQLAKTSDDLASHGQYEYEE